MLMSVFCFMGANNEIEFLADSSPGYYDRMRSPGRSEDFGGFEIGNSKP